MIIKSCNYQHCVIARLDPGTCVSNEMKRNAVAGVIDQGLQSIVNLVIGIFLIRYASKEDYGIYGVAYSIILLIVGFANAFIMTQMTVNLHQKEIENRHAYCGSMFLLGGLLSILIVAVFILIGKYKSENQYWSLFYVLAISIPGYTIMEFVKVYYYLQQRAINALISNIIISVFFILFAFLSYKTFPEHLHFNVILAYSFSAIFVSLINVFGFIKFPMAASITILTKSLKESLSNGLWAFGGVIVTSLQNQGWIYILAGMKGMSNIADANAARLFLSPIGILSTSFNRVFMPKVAQLNAENKTAESIKLSIKIMFLLLTIATVYCAGLMVFLDLLVDLFMTKEYREIGNLVLLWSIYYIAISIRGTPAQILQVFKKFKIITLSNGFIALVWFAATIWIAKEFGVEGMIVSMTIAELVLSVMLWVGVGCAR